MLSSWFKALVVYILSYYIFRILLKSTSLLFLYQSDINRLPQFFQLMFFGLILLFLQIQRSCHWWHLLAHTIKEVLLWLLSLTECCQVLMLVVWVTYYYLRVIWLSRICDRFLLNASFLLHIFFLNNVSSNLQNVTHLTLHIDILVI